ncbi:Uncharacterised protein g7523 [Pycnogonum litorale]
MTSKFLYVSIAFAIAFATLATAEDAKDKSSTDKLKTAGAKFNIGRSHGYGGGYGGGYGNVDHYDDDDDHKSGLGSIIGLFALLLGGLALCAALLGPFLAIIGLGANNNNLLTPTINGGTLSVLPTAVTGRRKRNIAGQANQSFDKLVSILTSLGESIDKYSS